MPNKSLVAECFELSLVLEHSMRAYYRTMAKRFSNSLPIHDFLSLMAVDETKHIALLEKMRLAAHPTSWTHEALSAVLEDLFKLSHLIDQAVACEGDNFLEVFEQIGRIESSKINDAFIMLTLGLPPGPGIHVDPKALIQDHLKKIGGLGLKMTAKEMRNLKPIFMGAGV